MLLAFSTAYKWSGRQDLNLRPSVPKTDALPGCATPRHFAYNTMKLEIKEKN